MNIEVGTENIVSATHQMQVQLCTEIAFADLSHCGGLSALKGFDGEWSHHNNWLSKGFWTGFGTDFEIGSGGLGALLGAFGALIFTIHEVVSEARNKTNNNMRKVMKYCVRNWTETTWTDLVDCIDLEHFLVIT